MEQAVSFAKIRVRQLAKAGKRPRFPGAIPGLETSALSRPGVYLFWCEGFIKIGYADNPQHRLSCCQTGNPFEVRMIGVIPSSDPIALEEELHCEFEYYRVRGEWFNVPEDKVRPLILRALVSFEANKANWPDDVPSCGV